MSISTLIHRPNCDDIPVKVEVEQDGESFHCQEEAVVTQIYRNNDMSEVAYDVGDKIYLTGDEQKQIEEQCLDNLFDQMSYTQRLNYYTDCLRESRGY